MFTPRPRTARITGLLAATAVASAAMTPAFPAFAVTGPEPAAGQHAYAVQLQLGDEANGRACTGTLVDRLWVLTAASCFAAAPGTTVPAGKPALATTATLSDGKTFGITEIAPRADRDVVLARLSAPVDAIKPATVAKAAPAPAASVTAAGFGRTKTEWVTDKLHLGAFTVDSLTATTLAITGKGTDAICKGDTGGPLLDASGAVSALASRSWQGGCFGTPSTETRTGAIAARVDDLGPWIGQVTAPRRGAVNEAGGSERIRWADWDGDGKPDYINVADNGAVSVWLNHGGNQSGPNGWEPLGQIATGLTTDRNRVRFADFDGDGKADYILINTDGSVSVFRNEGGDGRGGWKDLGKVAVGVTSDPTKVRFADWDGDGRTDYLVFDNGGGVVAYLNRGGDAVGSQGWFSPGKITTGSTSERARVRFADSDGDGKADYFLIKPDGKVDLYLNRGGDVVPNTGWSVVGQIATGLTTDHTKVQFVDFNADTHADYVLAGAGNSATVFAWNGGDKGNGWIDLGKVASGT
ncbi:FG-GAP-like repeat-containing protein [Streptomyces flavotricini]|uniref:FG-GAP-like repeat-containing protein n=1 Tax=Streptomyces flavotricini TaxID=66888 RepID=A0ABS8E947_9ACTN|nr:FG-GAP-like repeat-containing protein [Streptomyces flavotricini]MCC0097661.1 FG-GAP-like repeat-containing protein [Streptomyces flavotricini]